jgi:hypothetical protein
LTEYAPTNQYSQQPTQRVGVCANPCRELIDPKGLFREGVGDAEIGRHRDRLRRPTREDELQHRHRRRNQPLV